MKLLRKFSILLLSAAIFMSALVVFAGSSDEELPEWPYLKFTITLSSRNNIVDSNEANLNSKVSSAVGAPFYALTRDYPDIAMWIHGFYLTSYYSYQTGSNPIYSLSKLDYTLYGYKNYTDPKGMLVQLRDAVDDFSPSGETVYDKLVSIHDFICKTNTYVKESEGALYHNSAYGALVHHKSVCEGYAEAFKLLCDKAGIDCILVTGMSLSEPDKDPEAHMWNLVRMDDDVWYAVDVTWDDAGDVEGVYNYFLVGADTVIRGKTFTESHMVSYNFKEIEGSGKTIPNLEYPTLSDVAYDKENGSVDYLYGGERFHYGFLDDAQKEIYDKMLSALQNNMPSDPNKTPVIETTDSVTTTPENTTAEPQTTPNETTTKEDTTKADSTTPDQTTTPEITTEPPVDTTTDTNTVGTTPSNTTKPPVTTVQKDTDPPVSSTTNNPDTTVTDSASDTTKKPDNTGNVTTSSQRNGSHEREMQRLYKTVTTVVIISAITSLSMILGIFVIRYAKRTKK